MAQTAENLELSITDSMARRLRLSFAALTGEQRLSAETLLETSSRHLDTVVKLEGTAESQIAHGVLSCPREFLRWETEHARAMRRVAFEPRRRLQLRALLRAAMQMTHRAALFEFLRAHQVRGPVRRRLVHHFHGQLNYTQSLVAEHGHYLRSSASLLCARHLLSSLFEDPKATEALDAYARTYNDYFAAYCTSAVRVETDESSSALLPEIKLGVSEARRQLQAWGEPRPGV